MMVGQSVEIQQLLEAEQRGREIVAAAKKRKTKRLKEAKEEAQEVIEEYRKKREKQYKEFERKHLDTRVDVSDRIDADTTLKIEEMNKAISVNKNAVVDKILELVYDIKPELPKNFKLMVKQK